ncbi:MAG: nucleotidyltransferase domain-containing protein [Candidatus Omnitrophica bacterium]|nr:nucleotidyltransferase domain-containing protein [Candidatus Omnitrophota bacterium]MBU1133992.1 nucleotidyltransferase domain-containing protein [Candidatus Omnitrophota bacterium]MBU1810159.1 nucleotidyltransferase domain-containing protein [Candidatus Omnitrophota bacterium]
MTKIDLKQLAKKYKLALAKNNIPISAIYLFGSYAAGRARQSSDIDFCVVSSIFGRDDFEEMVMINQIAKRVAPEIEAFPVSEKEMKKGDNPFIKEALKTGKRII